MTLIEITVVILVLLTLISVLFIGASAYKKGADRAACILNIRNVHQAVRVNQNLKGGTTYKLGDIFGSGKYFEEYVMCPNKSGDEGSFYVTHDWEELRNGDTFRDALYPPIGTAVMFCIDFDPNEGYTDPTLNHAPQSTDGW